MAIYQLTNVAQNPGAQEGKFPVDTTATGSLDTYIISPLAGTGIGVTLTAASTAVVKLQATTDTVNAINAGTAIWFDVGAPWTAVTTGAIVGGGIAYAVSALRVNTTTALAGLQATITIRTNQPRW